MPSFLMEIILVRLSAESTLKAIVKNIAIDAAISQSTRKRLQEVATSLKTEKKNWACAGTCHEILKSLGSLSFVYEEKFSISFLQYAESPSNSWILFGFKAVLKFETTAIFFELGLTISVVMTGDKYLSSDLNIHICQVGYSNQQAVNIQCFRT